MNSIKGYYVYREVQFVVLLPYYHISDSQLESISLPFFFTNGCIDMVGTDSIYQIAVVRSDASEWYCQERYHAPGYCTVVGLRTCIYRWP